MITIYGDVAPVDILAIGVHPDDIELSCAATILKQRDLGYTVGIVDLTKGELGTRGSASIRMEEAATAAEILDVQYRVNLEMRDGFFVHDERHVLRVVEAIRMAQPKIILANSLKDRHPDHGRAAKLVAEAHFYAGLRRIETPGYEAHRAHALYHYIQDKNLNPDFVVDVTGYVDQKVQAIQAFSTQFFVDNEEGIQTPISGKSFLDFILAKMKTYGRPINAEYAEGFNVDRHVGVDDLMHLK